MTQGFCPKWTSHRAGDFFCRPAIQRAADESQRRSAWHHTFGEASIAGAFESERCGFSDITELLSRASRSNRTGSIALGASARYPVMCSIKIEPNARPGCIQIKAVISSLRGHSCSSKDTGVQEKRRASNRRSAWKEYFGSLIPGVRSLLRWHRSTRLPSIRGHFRHPSGKWSTKAADIEVDPALFRFGGGKQR